MLHNSEDTEQLGYWGVTFIPAEGLVSMYVAVTDQRDNSLFGEPRIVIECLLADVVQLWAS